MLFSFCALVLAANSVGVNIAGDRMPPILEFVLETNSLFKRIFFTVGTILCTGFIILSVRSFRGSYSYTYFDEEGVHCKSFIHKDIFIPWNECSEIGLVLNHSTPMFDPPELYIYFSRKPLPPKKSMWDWNICKVIISEDYLWIRSSKNVRKDVLQYIEEDIIKHRGHVTEHDPCGW